MIAMEVLVAARVKDRKQRDRGFQGLRGKSVRGSAKSEGRGEGKPPNHQTP
jgi:hypothetical protein